MGFAIGTDFDRAIRWDARLDQELPFLRAWLRSWNAEHVLDLGCGTGRHCLALADQGFQMTGVDNDPAMLEAARALLAAQPGRASSCVFQHGDLAQPPAGPPVDAALCLGNSLCLLPDEAAVARALAGIQRRLRPRGGLILHVLNYMRFRDPLKAFFPLRTETLPDGALRHFLKVIDLRDGQAYVNLVRMEQEAGQWVRHVRSQRLLRLDAPLLLKLLAQAGFGEMQGYGSLQGGGYDADSHDLVICCRRP